MKDIGTWIVDRFGRQGRVIGKTNLSILEPDTDEGDLPFLKCQDSEGQVFYCCEYECEPYETEHA